MEINKKDLQLNTKLSLLNNVDVKEIYDTLLEEMLEQAKLGNTVFTHYMQDISICQKLITILKLDKYDVSVINMTDEYQTIRICWEE